MVAVNKTRKWSELAKEYPDQWAFIKDEKEDEDGNMLECYVYIVCPFEEYNKYLVEFRNDGKEFNCKRTTPSFPVIGAFSFYET